MGNLAHFGRRYGWRAVSDPEFWRQAVILGTADALSMAILACTVSLTRDTTGHDWCAVAKLTVAELVTAPASTRTR